MKNNKWNGKVVLVTGANGLLGPWLIEDLLEKGAFVVVLLRDHLPNSLFFLNKLHEKTTVAWGDLLDYRLLERIINEFSIEIIFHLGAQAIVGHANRSPISTFKSNIEGTWNLLEAVRHSPWVKKVIVASSDKAYGEHSQLPYTEEMPLQGKHPYDVSKSCADLIAQSYFYTYKLPLCITRCGNFFGGGDFHFNRLIPGTIYSLLRNESPLVRSNGQLIRDYIYVRDVVSAYLTLAEAMDDTTLHGEAFNFSTDTPHTVLEIVSMLLAMKGNSQLKPTIENRSTHEIPNQHLSSIKARTRLGWVPQYGIKEGLKETYAWYEKWYKGEVSESCREKIKFETSFEKIYTERCT